MSFPWRLILQYRKRPSFMFHVCHPRIIFTLKKKFHVDVAKAKWQSSRISMHCGSSITLTSLTCPLRGNSIDRSRSASPCAQGQGSQKPHLSGFCSSSCVNRHHLHRDKSKGWKCSNSPVEAIDVERHDFNVPSRPNNDKELWCGPQRRGSKLHWDLQFIFTVSIQR